MKLKNPIIPGFNPDTSVVRAETAGLIVLQHNFNELALELALEGERKVARCVKHRVTPIGGLFDGTFEREETVLGRVELPPGTSRLALRADGQSYSFYAAGVPVAEEVRAEFLGSETAGGFVGAYIGVFASENGADSPVRRAFQASRTAAWTESAAEGRPMTNA